MFCSNIGRLGLLLVLLTCALTAFGKKKALLRYDGLYQTAAKVDSDGDTSYYFLRFYESGKVLAVTSTGVASDLREWFHLKMPNPSVGTYKIKGRQIRFPSVNSYGTVEYEGKVADKEHLELNIHSLINGHKRSDKFFFVPVAGLK